MSKLLKALFVLVIPVFLISCAPPKLPDIIWPGPPDPPRIKFIRSFHSGRDLKGSSIVGDVVLGGSTSYTMRKPNNIHVDKDGRLLVTDTAHTDVFIYDFPRKKVSSVKKAGTSIFFKPIGVTTDKTGRIFVSDTRTDQVAVLDEKGRLMSYLSPAIPFKQPTGLAVDNANDLLYVVDTHLHNVQVFDLKTLKHQRTIGERGKEEGSFNFPSHLAVDANSNIYVVDTMNARMQVFDVKGRFLYSYGQFGDAPGEFARPKGVAIDSEGHVYVVDAAFNNVQIFDDEGRILMSFGGYGTGRGQMILPAGIAIDKDDFIYVTDSWNERVDVYEYLGEKHKAREAAGKGKK
ncbi:MAG: 6-bladed beta-propeller [Thermodesulfobacteriota bacterium]